MTPATSILRSATPILFAVMGLHALGCLSGPSESGLTEEDFLGNAELGIAGDPGTSNHYNVECFLDHGVQQTFRDLAAGPLADGDREMPAMPYMPDANATGLLAGCRGQALELLVECALNVSEGVHDGESDKYPTGALGYAPDWTTRGLTTDEKELVTACMLQRLNPYGVTIPILLEKPSAPNSTTDYAIHESMAWGNLFDSTVTLNPTRDPALPTNLAFSAYACDEGDRPSFCDTQGSIVPWNLAYTVMRTCFHNEPDCHWVPLGSCTSTCPYDPYNPTRCDAWDNRLRARARDDGSLCGLLEPTEM